MKTDVLTVGELHTNCYLVYDGETHRGFVVDPGADAARIVARLSRLEIRPEAILLTHGHFDHILAAEELRDRFHIPVYAHEAEASLLSDPSRNLSAMWASPVKLRADRLLRDGEILPVAGTELTVLHTPGHTKGGVCYYMEQEKILLAGDTLFCESFGRTDFPGGSMSELISSLRRKLFVLPEETVVYPGHDAQTDIGHEKRFNPAAGR